MYHLFSRWHKLVHRLLKVENLKLSVDGRVILTGVNFSMDHGSFHVLFGPNGTGKSTFLKAIMGIYGEGFVEGKIYFEGVDITHLPIYERAKLGISLMFQQPPSFDGLKVADLINAIEEKFGDSSKLHNEVLDVRSFYDRDLFKNFSGGERKKVELFLASLQKPKLLMLDEPDSGVDVENIRLIGKYISNIIDSGISVLLVTHHGFILDYITAKPDLAHIMINGSIVLSGNPRELIDVIMRHGYKRGLEILLKVQ